MERLDCKCDLNCRCGCRLRKTISNLLDVIATIETKRSALSEILDCEVLGFDGMTDILMNTIGELLEIEKCCTDDLIEIIFDFVFKRNDKYDTIDRLLEL